LYGHRSLAARALLGLGSERGAAISTAVELIRNNGIAHGTKIKILTEQALGW